ncbi:Rho-related GTP-binding protein RhoH [Trichinella spiralis]|uniref:Rho-related GTP-binding protein RhoH n=1 Tax=Trichinella spiralis TaxID=6334 RepID=A0ABR3K9T1_TRISP
MRKARPPKIALCLPLYSVLLGRKSRKSSVDSRRPSRRISRAYEIRPSYRSEKPLYDWLCEHLDKQTVNLRRESVIHRFQDPSFPRVVQITVSFKSAVDVLITALQLVLLKIISSGNNAFIGVVHSFDSESRSFVLISDCHHSRGSICVQVVYGYNIESLEILNHVLTSHDKKLLERFSQRIATSPRIP